MNESLIHYYRCPEHYARLGWTRAPSGPNGYFRFGDDTFCYGRCSKQLPVESSEDGLYDASSDAVVGDGTVSLPFDLAEVVTNLRQERYGDSDGVQKSALQSALGDVYYHVRPL